MDKNFTCKIADFGVSRNMSHRMDLSVSCSHSKHFDLSYDLGTPLYSAPEILNQETYDEKVDIYSLAIIYLELLCSFKTQHERLKVLSDIKNVRELPQLIQDKYCHEYSLLTKMLKADPRERYSVIDVLNDTDYEKLKYSYMYG